VGSAPRGVDLVWAIYGWTGAPGTACFICACTTACADGLARALYPFSPPLCKDCWLNMEEMLCSLWRVAIGSGGFKPAISVCGTRAESRTARIYGGVERHPLSLRRLSDQEGGGHTPGLRKASNGPGDIKI
jgi:hypothetical protein